MKAQYDIGLVGLGVMGRNFVLNLADHGHSVLGLDNDPEKGKQLKAEAGGKQVEAAAGPSELVAGLKAPRTIILLVPAGNPVDAVIDELMPKLSPGDCLVDAGNSHFRDTERRAEKLEAKGLHFIGMGVSGGEEGARRGPSLMPGGNKEAYERLRPALQAVAAKVNGEPCVDYIGPKGSGHYVKMVHNAIEYGWMQLIAETADILHRSIGMGWNEIADRFAEWNRGELEGFLVEITAEVLRKQDEGGGYLVDRIADVARQKGTGKWASEEGKTLQVPIPTIDQAVTWRDLSKWRVVREALHKQWSPARQMLDVREELLEIAPRALYAGMLLTMDQGMALLAEASNAYHYDLNLASIARLWRGGCIIRAKSLELVASAFGAEPTLPRLIADQKTGEEVCDRIPHLRGFCRAALLAEISIPSHSASIDYWDAVRDVELPMNVVQAQRDFFGAHGFERRDRPGVFHGDWKAKS